MRTPTAVRPPTPGGVAGTLHWAIAGENGTPDSGPIEATPASALAVLDLKIQPGAEPTGENEIAVDGPALTGTSRARGARCLRLWACVGGGSLLIRRYLCSRQRRNDYRSDTDVRDENHRVANAGAKNRPPQRKGAAKARKFGSSDKGGAVMSGTQWRRIMLSTRLRLFPGERGALSISIDQPRL